jgi:hypothetical protein
MRMNALLLLFGLAALGCDAKPPRPSNSPLDLDLEIPGNLQLAYRNIKSTNGDFFDAKIDEAMRTFDRFPSFQKSFATASEVTVHKGTPRDEPPEDRPTVTIDNGEFYSPPTNANGGKLNQLKDIFSTTDYVYPFRGLKNCGGFHADWRLAWNDGEDEWIAYICFGCGEMSVVKNGANVLYCDLRQVKILEGSLSSAE